MKPTLKLARNRLPSIARPAESKPARRAPATAHDGLDRYLRAVNYLAAAQVYLQAMPHLCQWLELAAPVRRVIEKEYPHLTGESERLRGADSMEDI